MSNQKHTPPEYGVGRFCCPHCGVHAKQDWLGEFYLMQEPDYDVNFRDPHIVHSYPPTDEVKESGKPIYRIHCCQDCDQHSLWVNKKLVYPQGGIAPPPNSDFSENVLKRYQEADKIFSVSPGSAAALLRYALETLCEEQGGEGWNLRAKIDDLIKKKDLSPKTGDMMHSVRITGNSGAHPGIIDLDETPETVVALFHLLNYVADQILTSKRYERIVNSALTANKKKEEKA